MEDCGSDGSDGAGGSRRGRRCARTPAAVFRATWWARVDAFVHGSVVCVDVEELSAHVALKDPCVSRWYACMFRGLCARRAGRGRVVCWRPSQGCGVHRRCRRMPRVPAPQRMGGIFASPTPSFTAPSEDEACGAKDSLRQALDAGDDGSKVVRKIRHGFRTRRRGGFGKFSFGKFGGG